jgi:DNA replication protein DnaC
VENKTTEQLRFLSMNYLLENWDSEIKKTETEDWTAIAFLKYIIKKEYDCKKERSRLNRTKSAKAPIQYSIDTYPFSKQPHLNKKRLLGNYESLNYIHENRNITVLLQSTRE